MNRRTVFRVPMEQCHSTQPEVLRSNKQHPEAGRGLPTSSAKRATMKLFQHSTLEASLRAAWSRIRENGLRSQLKETKDAVEIFDQDSETNIRRLQRALRRQTFEFAPQKGVIKAKRSGGQRGIVMAPVRNRIVERAWLDCLQSHVSFVRDVIATPTSVGGVPDRSVPHGLALIASAMSDGKCYFLRSDISGFFDSIPRKDVLDTLSTMIDDERFFKFLELATEVTLSNEEALGENRKIFPTNNEGVAQGSPLSPLFGNILLNEFDQKFNERGIACIRFIDDFVMLGSNPDHLAKAFENAKAHLKERGLRCHDPYSRKMTREKAERGNIEDGFTFLGYYIEPGLLLPSNAARKSLLASVDRHFREGRKTIEKVDELADSFARRQRYVQTLDFIDSVVRGWGKAFAYCNSPSTMKDLDKAIDVKNLKLSELVQTQETDDELGKKTPNEWRLSFGRYKAQESRRVAFPYC